MNVKNAFVNMSRLEDYFIEHCIDTDRGYGISFVFMPFITFRSDETIDCLLDRLKIKLFNLRAFEGLRIPRLVRREEKVFAYRAVQLFFKVELGPTVSRGVFEQYDFQIMSKNVFDKQFDLDTDVFRNLDSALSHNGNYQLKLIRVFFQFLT